MLYEVITHSMSVLVGKKAPDFKAAAVMADGTINGEFALSDYAGKYVVLFFYPLDFTFVITSYSIHYTKLYEKSRTCCLKYATFLLTKGRAPWMS